MLKRNEEQTNMMIKLLTLLVLLSSATAQKKRPKGCSLLNITPQKCMYGKRTSGCIPRVNLHRIKREEITPRTFIARWDAVGMANCYYVELLTGYTTLVMKTFPCYKRTQIRIKGLEPWITYSIQVSAVNYRCKQGRTSVRRTARTLWAPTAVATTTARPTDTPKPRECGKGYFTCQSNKKQCIPNENWCDKKFHCDDGSDERACPGGCKELDIDFKHGNYSCTKWGSPRSFCFFDCKAPYVRDGNYYTQCHHSQRKWTHPIPICRMSPPENVRLVPDETTATSLTAEWEPVDGAVQYIMQATLTELVKEEHEFASILTINATDCCTATIEKLKPNSEYVVTLQAIDEDGLHGIESLTVSAQTALGSYAGLPVKKGGT